MITLSKRLKAIADMVKPCSVVADVGCDHGFLSIYLVENDIAGRGLATDINAGPLERAEEHIREYRMENRIETIQCDGLSGIGYADAIVIAGMGGRLMVRILSEGDSCRKTANQLILGPQSELEYFRNSLCEMGYMIDAEDFILDEGKYYPIIHAVRGDMKLDRTQAMYGPCLLRDANKTLKEFLLKERDYKLDILWNLTGNKSPEESDEISAKTGQRINELKEELVINEKALRIIG